MSVNPNFKYQCGDELKDIITGFTGIVTARTEWFNGCKRYLLQPKKLKKDGGIQEELWFDEQQVVAAAANRVRARRTDTGGPQRDPKLSKGDR